MAKFQVVYDITHRYQVTDEIEAESEQEARRLVEEYEVDDADAKMVDSYEYSRSNVFIQK